MLGQQILDVEQIEQRVVENRVRVAGDVAVERRDAVVE